MTRRRCGLLPNYFGHLFRVWVAVGVEKSLKQTSCKIILLKPRNCEVSLLTIMWLSVTLTLAVGLPFRVIFYSSTRPSTLTSTRVIVNTGSTLIQAVNDEEGGSGLVSQRIWGPKGSRPWSSVTVSLCTSWLQAGCCKWNSEAQTLH